MSLWPLFYAGKLAFFPNVSHARLMIETFGGAFVVGFLGTAGPRMAGAPKLTTVELAVLFTLHMANGVFHLRARTQAGDACFFVLLAVVMASLALRVARFRREWPPPQMLLALTGLLCGLAGTALWLWPGATEEVPGRRLAGLLLYQGLLLAPVLGIGSFLFPRILGNDFGEPASPEDSRRRLVRAGATAAALVASFPIEAWGWPRTGCLLRASAAAGLSAGRGPVAPPPRRSPARLAGLGAVLGARCWLRRAGAGRLPP